MREMICIVCPRGCHLSVGASPEYEVRGNLCSRGERYAKEEMQSPARTVTATCPVIDNVDFQDKFSGENPKKNDASYFSSAYRLYQPRRVPVKTNVPVPKDRVAALVALLLHTSLSLPVHAGDIIIGNWEGLGVSVVVTRDLQ